MVQQNLVDYILTQLRQGRRLEDINKFLISAGYEAAEVESSVQYVINLQTNPQLAEEQRIQQLTSYINTQLKAGYNQQAIANFLISRGYPYYEVNSALQQATLPVKEARTEHKLVIFALIAMFIMTAAVTVMYFKAYTLIGIGVPEKLLDVEAEQLTAIVQQGGTLTFQVKLINFGYEKRFDVEMHYQVIDRATQTVVLEKTETLALSTTLESIVTFDISEDMKTGKYVLRADATYKEFTATAGFIFDVLPKDVAKETIEAILKNVTKPENVTIPELAPNVTEPVPEVPEAVPTPIPAAPETKFYEGMTKTQAFANVKAVSVREPQRAISMCKEFDLAGNEESCIIMLAKFKKAPAICNEINSSRGQDSCYMQVIIDLGQYDLCNEISDPQIKSSCELVGKASQTQQLAQQGKTDDIRFLLQTFPQQG